MLRALLKKQFLELNQFYFKNPKTGENRKGLALAGFIGLFALLFACVAWCFACAARLCFSVLLPLGLDWLGLGAGAVLSLLASAVVSLFFCYSSLFRAKDNSLLFALPIPPRVILTVRLSGVAAMCLFFAALTWLPFCAMYFAMAAGPQAPVSAGRVALCLAVVLIIAVLGIVLVCVIGWVIAAIGGHVRNKGLATAIATLALLFAYVFAYMQLVALLEGSMGALAQAGEALKANAWPLYQLGLAAMGDAAAFCIMLAIALVLLAVVFAALSATFVKVATTQAGARTGKGYDAAQVRAHAVGAALLSRELRHLAATPVYLANCCLGLVILMILAVLAVVQVDAIREVLAPLASAAPVLAKGLPVIVSLAVCMLAGMSYLTAPSISLEGRELWIIRSLPVGAVDVLAAKAGMQVRVASIPVLACALAVGYALGFGVPIMLLIALECWVFLPFNAYMGLALNLKYPNFIWNSPAVPVKQSLPVAVTLFGSWVLCIAAGLAYFLALAPMLDAAAFVGLMAIAFACAAFALRHWVRTRGAQIFDTL